MICVPLTNHGAEHIAGRFVELLDTGVLDRIASASSELKKMRAQNARLDRIRKAEEPDGEE